LEQLQEKETDFERVKGYFGADKICDIEADVAKSTFGTIVQRYLKPGHNKSMAEALAREIFRYEPCK